jgi:PAS domain S-box-containing protein
MANTKDLRVAVQVWERLAEEAGAVIWVVALHGGDLKAAYVNPAYTRIFGRSRESFSLDPWSALQAVHRDDQERLVQLLEQLTRGQPVSAELRLVRPRGEVRWLAVEGFPLPAGEDGVHWLAGLAVDITPAKEAEAARQETQARLQAIFASPSLGIGVMSADGDLLEANQHFRRMLGHGGDLEHELRAMFTRLTARGESFAQREKRYVRRDHQVVWTRLSLSLVQDAAGRPQGGMCLLENVTGHRRVEEALKLSRERFRLLYEKAPLGYQALDEEGRFLDVNQTWLDMTGYGREEIIGRWFGSLLVKESAALFEEVFAALRQGADLSEVELDLVCRDGRRLPVALTGKAATDEGGGFQQAHLMVADLTRRKQAERERQTWQSILASTFKAFQDLILVLDRNLRVVMSNWRNLPPGAEKCREGSFCYQCLLGKDLPCEPCHVREVFASGQMRQVERSSQDGRTWEIRAFPILDEQQQVMLVVQQVVDVTERRRAEEALRRSEQNYRLLVGSIPGVVFKGYADWGLEVFDDKVEELTGYPREDFAAGRLKWSQLILPEDREEARALFLQALRTTRSYVRSYRIRHRDGRIVWVQARGQIILNDQGRIDHVSGVLFDITRQKETEHQLEAEKERLAVTLRSIGDGVIATDTAGRIVLMNQVAEDLTGWTQAEALGLPASQVFAIYQEQSGQRCEDPVAQVIQSGQTVGLANSTMLLSRDQRALSVAASSAPIIDGGGQVLGVVLVFRDITVRKQMEGELLKVEKLSSLGILAGGIAHDFNNILTGILGNISLAMLSAKEGESLLPRLAEAEQATLRARDLVQQLLTFAKGGAPVKEVASLAEIIQESANFTCRGSQVRPVCEFVDDLKPAEVDPAQISQVIQNLILNAVQAMPTGGTIRVTAQNVTLCPDSGLPLTPGHYVKIGVHDQGIGIPKAYLHKIFDPYFSTKQKGSGLGLATAYSIVKNHDGYMTVDSEPGKGTVFHLYLPASGQPVPRARPPACEPVAGRGRVLVMDDDDTVRSVAGKILTHLGYEVEFALDGEEALRLFAHAAFAGRPFDAIIMDLTIPGGMGGKETIQRLLDLAPDARAIVSSGYADDPIMTHYQEYGFKGVIRKPYRVTAFSQELARVLAASPESPDADPTGSPAPG